MGVPEGEEREKGAREIFEVILSENYPKLMTDIKTKIQVLREPQQGKYQKVHLGI